MADETKLDVCEVHDNTVGDGHHQADSGNQWHLSDTTNSPCQGTVTNRNGYLLNCWWRTNQGTTSGYSRNRLFP